MNGERTARLLRVAELIPGDIAAVAAEVDALPKRITAATAELPVGTLLTLEQHRAFWDRRPRWLALARLRARLAEIERRSSRLTIVAAAIIRDGKVLVAQRSYPEDLASKWEFPGGKVERGETPRAGLAREIEEELGAKVVVGEELGRHELADRVRLILFQARLAAGSTEPEAREHRQLRWVRAHELGDLDWAGTNGRFVTDVTRRL